jgi:hypothetical protein
LERDGRRAVNGVEKGEGILEFTARKVKDRLILPFKKIRRKLDER